MKKNFGGMGNINQMMKQVQKMQQDMAKMQEEMGEKTVEATAGGGVVRAVANGHKQIVEIKIDPQAVDSEDIEMLEDLILAAVNESLRMAEEMMAAEMKKLTGGMNIPGLF
jgi:hypothetical protein